MRVVEEVALDAPRLFVDLFPHGTRLDVDLHRVEMQRTESGLGRSAGVRWLTRAGHRPLLAFAVENLLAVERDGIVVYLFQKFVELSFLCVPSVEGLREIGALLIGGDDHRAFRHK